MKASRSGDHHSPRRTQRGYAATKVGKAGFTAEAQSTQRFFLSNSPLRVLSVSAVSYPKLFVTGTGEFAQAKTFKRYKVRRELVNALDEEARRKIGEEKQKQVEE